MMSETLRLEIVVASGVFSQTMPAERRLCDVDRVLLEDSRREDRRATETTIIGRSTWRVLRQLEDHDDGEERRSRDAGEEAAHAEQRVAADGRLEARNRERGRAAR